MADLPTPREVYGQVYGALQTRRRRRQEEEEETPEPEQERDCLCMAFIAAFGDQVRTLGGNGDMEGMTKT